MTEFAITLLSGLAAYGLFFGGLGLLLGALIFFVRD